MPPKTSARVSVQAVAMLAQETLYVGVDVGKKAHGAFVHFFHVTHPSPAL
jgi:hypothetical protein